MKLILFLSSYAPLGLIVAILYAEQAPLFALVAAIVGIASVIGLLIFLNRTTATSALKVVCTEVKRNDGETVSYLVSYVLPFMMIPSDDFSKIIGMVIFFFLLGFLYLNSSLIHINPTLNMLGWHVYEITTANNRTYSLLAKKRPDRGDEIRIVKIDDDTMMEVGNAHQ